MSLARFRVQSLVPLELSLVPPSDCRESFFGFLELADAHEITWGFGHPDEEDDADDLPDVANETVPEPLRANLPKIDRTYHVDQGLLHVPNARHVRLCFLRHHFGEIVVAYLDANRTQHAGEEPQKDHHYETFSDQQARIQKQIAHHSYPEDFPSAFLIRDRR